MVKEIRSTSVANEGSIPVVVRPVKQTIVRDIKGSLALDSSDWYVYASAVELSRKAGIPTTVAAHHIHEGHGYPLEEVDLANVPFRLKNGPIGGINISPDSIVTYEIIDAQRTQISGPETSSMVVATRSNELGSVNIGQDEKQVEMTIGLREQQNQLASYDVQGEADKIIEQVSQDSLDQARATSPFLHPEPIKE